MDALWMVPPLTQPPTLSRATMCGTMATRTLHTLARPEIDRCAVWSASRYNLDSEPFAVRCRYRPQPTSEGTIHDHLTPRRPPTMARYGAENVARWTSTFESRGAFFR